MGYPTLVSKTGIADQRQGVSVIFCIRNERFRLPFFFQYYREMGVTEFFAVDNDSTDGTLDWLLSQPDAHVFHTDQSYKASNAGRDWTSYIAKKYCRDTWCLTLDVDEFFIYPFKENLPFAEFIAYLDQWGFEGVFGIFLDFYSNKPLSETQYIAGDSVFDVCNYFDKATSYKVFETPNFPYLQIKGGPRQRMFWDASTPKSGPSMRKLVLAKWRGDFDYLHSTHSSTDMKLADLSCVVGHFKFLSHLKEFSKSEVERNDRVANSADWKVYAERLEKDDLMLFDKNISIRYKNSLSLLESRLLSISGRYLNFF
ncbi:MAG: glycosyltransferase family 2 protein, partial [Pseudomonadota bacterium]